MQATLPPLVGDAGLMSMSHSNHVADAIAASVSFGTSVICGRQTLPSLLSLPACRPTNCANLAKCVMCTWLQLYPPDSTAAVASAAQSQWYQSSQSTPYAAMMHQYSNSPNTMNGAFEVRID